MKTTHVSFFVASFMFFIVVKTNSQPAANTQAPVAQITPEAQVPVAQIPQAPVAPTVQAPETPIAGMGSPTDESLQMPVAQEAPQLTGAAPTTPTDPTQAAIGAPVAPVVAETLTGPDILQLSEEKVTLVKSNDPKISKIFDASEKCSQERASLIKSMTETAQSLKDTWADQEAKVSNFYQSFEFEKGKADELFSRIKKENKENKENKVA